MTAFLLAGMLTLDPEVLLAHASAKVEMCGYAKQEKKTLNDSHEPLPTQSKHEPKAGDPDPIKSISIPIIFRSERYQLADGGRTTYQEREVSIINFSPLPEKNMLKPLASEDWRFARVMNFLSGSVYIDRATGQIIRIDGRIEREVPYDKWFMTLFKVLELQFTYEQRLIDEKWMPSALNLHWRGRSKAGIRKMHDRYEIVFDCSQKAKAAP